MTHGRARGRWLGPPLLALALLPRSAAACATCSSGDATLAAFGTEQPFQGRLRSAAELRYRSDVVGAPGLDHTSVRELRADLALAWSVGQELILTADVPWLYRHVTDASLARTQSLTLGELELGAKWFFWRDRLFSPRWLAAVLGGAKLPTAPRLPAAPGRALPLEAQPGTGSLDAALGVSLAYFGEPVAGHASLSWREPLWVRAPLEPGRSVRASLALQAELLAVLMLRPIAELRWDQASRENGQRDPNSGGFVGPFGVDLAWSPRPDEQIVVGVRLPVWQRLHGAHREGASLGLALLRDW